MKHKAAAADQLSFGFQQALKRVPKAAVIVFSLTILLGLIISLNSPPLYFHYDTNPTATVLSHQSDATEPQEEIETSGPPSSIQTRDPPVAKRTLDANSSSPTLSSTPNQLEKDPVLLAEENSSETTESKWPDPPQGQAPVGKTGETETDDIELTGSEKTNSGQENCDLFTGEWVPNPEAPYYTNGSCYRIQDHQNCMKYGRPDMDYLRWRWKPDGCELPIFDPHQFLELMRGKSMAFVGDSVGRNHMQSLMCLLSRVVYPLDLSPNENSEYQHWVYKDYNFNISMFWTPYLIRSQITNPDDVTSPYSLYLDEYDESWTNKVETYDYIIISAAQWFLRPSLLHENGALIGCAGCKRENVTQFSAYFGYQKAFRTALGAINGLRNFRGVTFLRTITPSHFEGGVWDEGGDCRRKRPFKRNETVLEEYNAEMRGVQVRELRIAEEEGSKRGLRFRLFDATAPMVLRPDGHPSRYGHWPHQKVSNDCVHWCLPGPIDALNDLLLELLRREEGKNS